VLSLQAGLFTLGSNGTATLGPVVDMAGRFLTAALVDSAVGFQRT